MSEAEYEWEYVTGAAQGAAIGLIVFALGLPLMAWLIL